jgi:hypothetical protein
MGCDGAKAAAVAANRDKERQWALMVLLSMVKEMDDKRMTYDDDDV